MKQKSLRSPKNIFLPVWSPQNILWSPTNIFVLAALAVFVGHRLPLDAVPGILNFPTVVVPAVPPADLTPAQTRLFQAIQPLTAEEKSLLADFYSGFSRSVEADPPSEPVMPDTPALRRAHRAGVLFIWRGMAGNDAGKYPGLSDALEGVLTEAIGTEEVPINPGIRQSAVACFDKVAAICTSARR